MSNQTEITYSNPRLTAEFNDWPLGGNKRGVCKFHIEHNEKRGYRVVRQTTGKPKVNTYGGKAAIVDGSDGRTYILQQTSCFAFINIWRSDFMSGGAVFPTHAGYNTLAALIHQANPLA